MSILAFKLKKEYKDPLYLVYYNFSKKKKVYYKISLCLKYFVVQLVPLGCESSDCCHIKKEKEKEIRIENDLMQW